LFLISYYLLEMKFLMFFLLLGQTLCAPQNLVNQSANSLDTEPQYEELAQPMIASDYQQLMTAPNESYTEDTQPTSGLSDELASSTFMEAAVEPLPNVIPEADEELLVETSGRPFLTQTIILGTGKKLSEAITAKIVGPIVLFNSKVAAAAGALPPLLAAKGALIGSAIATPIEIGAVAGSSIASGVTGKLVAIPITVAAGAAAKFVDAAENGQVIWDFNVKHGHQILKNGLIKLGHIILKPIFVIGGAKTALTGAGLGIAGTGIKGVGVGMKAVGAKMVVTGLKAKALGHKLIVAQFPPYL